MDKKELKDHISKGWIRINMIFEMVGNPKKYIEDTMKSYMANIKTDGGVKVLEEDYGATEEIEKGLFSTYVEADMLVMDLEKLTWLCINFTPASIEIVEPTEFHFKGNKLQDWINDMLSRLHEVGSIGKQISAQNKLLINNMNRLIKNSMLMCINMGFDTPKEMEEKMGIPHKQLMPFFNALMKEGKIVLHEDKYKRPEEPKAKKSKAKKAKAK